jgi:hypothetical protein
LELFGIPGAILVQGGAVGVLFFAVLAVLLGKLHPDRTLDRIEKVHTDRLAQEKTRGDEWKAFGQAQGERNELLAQQLAELTEVGRTTNALIEGLRKATEQRSGRRP